MDEGGSKDEGGVKGGGILHLGDHQMWRDSTWSTSGTIASGNVYINLPCLVIIPGPIIFNETHAEIVGSLID